MSRRRPSVPIKLQPPGAGQTRRAWAVVALLGAVAGGCSTAQIDQIPHNVGGLPEGAPARPAVQAVYPAVHDMPPARAQPLLDEEQQKRLESDLTKVRNRQAPEQAKTKTNIQSKGQNTGQKPNP